MSLRNAEAVVITVASFKINQHHPKTRTEVYNTSQSTAPGSVDTDDGRGEPSNALTVPHNLAYRRIREART